MHSQPRFQGKVAVVTGGGAGIGRAIARRLSSEGASILIADRSQENGEATVKALPNTAYLKMDLGRLADAQRTVDAAVARFGRLDILINCAATLGNLKPLLETTAADWEEVLRTNVIGTFLLTQAAVRQMLTQGNGGAVVNILAIQAYSPLPNYSAYSSSKGALTSLTRSLAVELADKGIRVNGIAVGSIYTESTKEALDMPGAVQPVMSVPPEADRLAATLVGRMGRPDDIAAVACFLASEDAGYLAGAIVPADGGRMISRKPDPFLNVIQQQKAGS